ncbi:VHS domain-containing protein [Gorgonomyces haynaldii]|nr:VHS domain-containing protein [Gorgonomyces haynaldii]
MAQVLDNLKDLLNQVGLDTNESLIESMISQACSPDFGQPNLSLNLDIVDLINKRKGTMARDAAFTILRFVNRGNPTSAYLALTLLDNCVKNCGYAFHLVISSKEFLNELVKRFPETPRSITMTQNRILEMLQEWEVALCRHSRYKQDFKHINDMYRLLQYKGYRFPDLKESQLVGIVEAQGLKTEDELEKQDRDAQGAKLEALLRKGTPAALAEANDLMKVMSGYDTSRQRDYKQEVNSELDQIESKAILLNDMLNQRTPGQYNLRDSALDDLLGQCKNASTKLQNFIANNDDEDRMARLLELNDLINMVLQKHQDLMQGKAVQHLAIDRKRDSASTTADKVSPGQGGISLIDFDDQPSKPYGNQFGQTAGQPVFDPFANDLVGPSVPSQNHQLDLLSLGSALQPVQQAAHQPAQQPVDVFGLGAPSVQQNADPFAFGQFSKQQPKSLNALTPKPNMGLPLGQPSASLNTSLLGQPINPTPLGQSVNPVLGQATQRPVSPLAQQSQKPAAPLAQPTVQTVPPVAKEFTIFDKNGLQIKLQIQSPNSSVINARAVFINVTPVPFTSLVFQVAVPKTMQLQMQPPTSQQIAPLNQAPVYQTFTIQNLEKEALRMRFRVQYQVNGAQVTDGGEFQ